MKKAWQKGPGAAIEPVPACCYFIILESISALTLPRAVGPDNWKEMEGGSAHWLRTHSMAAVEHLAKPLLVEVKLEGLDLLGIMRKEVKL